MTLEVFHDIEESGVNIWLVGKLDLDLVKVAEGILELDSVSIGFIKRSHRTEKAPMIPVRCETIVC